MSRVLWPSISSDLEHQDGGSVTLYFSRSHANHPDSFPDIACSDSETESVNLRSFVRNDDGTVTITFAPSDV